MEKGDEMSLEKDKRADLAGPGIGTYEEVDRALPDDYAALLDPKQTQRALFEAKRFIEDGLCRELGLMMVSVPLIVDSASGVNDMLDRDGSRTPVDFDCGLGLDEPIHAEVVQAATKWKRMALREFGMEPGEGLCTDMRAVRKDYFLDHDHSSYVDQWDWEQAITENERNLDYRSGMIGLRFLQQGTLLTLDLTDVEESRRAMPLTGSTHRSVGLTLSQDLPRREDLGRWRFLMGLSRDESTAGDPEDLRQIASADRLDTTDTRLSAGLSLEF